MVQHGAQLSLWDGSNPLKIDKPLRLIELFAGIGAQAKALERLGVPFEHYRICEFDKYAVMSYNAIHGTNFKTSDIRDLKGADLGVVETDRFTYIMTYSFPCTDLSVAGKQAGMKKGTGTRSGLLWEVERLLSEMSGYSPHRHKPNGKIFSMTPYVDWYSPPDQTKLPQILLMENVPQVIGKKNIKDFAEWIAFLDTLGYTSKWAVLNAKDFNVPQNRERCFMVSWLGDHSYFFPQGTGCKRALKDVLEKQVDEKFYLSDSAVKYVANNVTPPRDAAMQSARVDEEVLTDTVGILLSKCGRKIEKELTEATTLMARDYKGFGNQAQTGVIEIRQKK